MSNLRNPANPDARSYHGTQALIRSSMGMSPETGISGMNDRLHAGAIYIAPISVDMDNETVEIYDLPPGTYVPEYLVSEGAGGTLGAVLIELLDADGVDQGDVIAAAPVAASTGWLPLTNPIEGFPTGEAHSIRVTPANGATATGVATMMLQMLPLITEWR
jgi:hypothetical protein